jgi:hypothetical protein
MRARSPSTEEAESSKVTIFALGVAACLIGAGNAHFVWLERDEYGPAPQ